MSTYTFLLYHIVFSTKRRVKLLTPTFEKRIYTYIWELLKNRNCVVRRMGGDLDHIHILTTIPADKSISSIVRDIKSISTKFVREEIDSIFDGWQDGYAGITISPDKQEVVINYIINQKEHHKKLTYIEEVMKMLDEAGVEYDKKYLEQ